MPSSPDIVRNKKYSKYLPWFELTAKTWDKSNEKVWFEEYVKDGIFADITARLNTGSFEQSDRDYVEDHDKFTEQVKRFEQVFIDEGFEKGIGIGVEKGIGIGREEGAHQKAVESAEKCLMKGFDECFFFVPQHHTLVFWQHRIPQARYGGFNRIDAPTLEIQNAFYLT